MKMCPSLPFTPHGINLIRTPLMLPDFDINRIYERYPPYRVIRTSVYKYSEKRECIMNGDPWYSQRRKRDLAFIGYLVVALLLICCLVPVVAAEPVSENAKAAVSSPQNYPYNGFRCLDKAPCFGGRLSFTLDGFAFKNGTKELFSWVDINWGDGSAVQRINQPHDTTRVTHIYKTPQMFTITITGYDYWSVHNSYTQHYNLDLSLMKGDILVHAIDDKSAYSSTFSPYVPGHWTHSAMYIGNNQTIESGWNEVKIHSVADWVYPADECVAIFRVTDLTDTQRQNIVNWAKEKVGTGYDLQSLTGLYSGKQQDNDDYSCWLWALSHVTALYPTCKWAGTNYYCSELVWAAYRRNGIDFDPYPPLKYVGDGGCVYPMDLVLSKHVIVQLVGTHIEKIPKRVKAYSTTDIYYGFLLNASPGDVVREPVFGMNPNYFMVLVNANPNAVVKDAVKSGSCDSCGPGGNSSEADSQVSLNENQKNTPAIDPIETRIINPDKGYMTDTYTTIPGSTVGAVDTDGDNIIEMMNSIENAEEGEYTISVTPKTGTGQDYTYSLRIGAWNTNQISWIEPVNYVDISSLPNAGKIPLLIEENGYCRMIAVPTRGTAPLNVSFMDISPLMRTYEDWDYEDMVINNQWDFGDGTSATNQVTATHLYSTPGSYRVMLTTRNATTEATAAVTVTIDAPVIPLKADFTASPVTGTTPLTVKFTDNSTGSPTRWVYNFGDGTTILGQNPTHTYRHPGTYTITQTVTKYNPATNSRISNSISKKNYITANSIPVVPLIANFTASPLQGTAPLEVRFTDQSTGNPTYYTYDFGDGTKALGPDAGHIYRYPGNYTVTLTVRKSGGNTGPMVSNSSIQKNLIGVSSR